MHGNQIHLPGHTKPKHKAHAELSLSKDQQDVWKSVGRNPQGGGRTAPDWNNGDLHLILVRTRQEARLGLNGKVVTHGDLAWPGPAALLQQVGSQHALRLLVRLRHSLQQRQHINWDHSKAAWAPTRKPETRLTAPPLTLTGPTLLRTVLVLRKIQLESPWLLCRSWRPTGRVSASPWPTT